MTQADSVWARLTAIISDITGHPADRLSRETALDQLPSWDSYANLQLISAVDEDFAVSITAKEAMQLRALGDMERFLLQRVKGA